MWMEPITYDIILIIWTDKSLDKAVWMEPLTYEIILSILNTYSMLLGGEKNW